MADQILKYAVKGVAAGIGLASESIHAHKENKRAKSQTREAASGAGSPPNLTRSASTDHDESKSQDEHAWALDDAQDELIQVHSPPTSPGSSDKPIRDVKILIGIFLTAHPLPDFSNLPPPPRLPFPVVLAQRRPKTRARGFIRAYAPVLINAGIDQAAFLDYLELFDKASQASPWLNAINLAGLAFSFLPVGISMAISVAIALSVKVAIEMQSRGRTNNFLDRMNDDYFRPRGLYCLILTWDPSSTDSHTTIDLSQTITSLTSPDHSLHQKYRHSSGTTPELPQTAPLIFPALDHLSSASASNPEAQTTRQKLIEKHAFVSTYFDNRAQAKYAAENPGGMLAQGPDVNFSSRYADPNHPASSGNIWSLVTGGHFNPPMGRELMGMRGEMMQQRRDMAWDGRRGYAGGIFVGWGGERGGYGRDAYGRELGYQQQTPQRGVSPGRGQPEYFEGVQGQQYETQASASDPNLSTEGKYMEDRSRSQYSSSSATAQSGLSPSYTPYQQQRPSYPGQTSPYGSGLLGVPAGFGAPELLAKGYKRVFGKNVLYMMVVNMPGEEELEGASKEADAAEKRAREEM